MVLGVFQPLVELVVQVVVVIVVGSRDCRRNRKLMLNRRELILNTLALVWLRTNTKLGEKPTNAKKQRSVVFNKLNLRDEAEWKMRARARKTPRPAETKRDLMVERGWTEATMGFGRGDSPETCSSSQLRTKETVTDGAEVPRRSVSYVEGKKKTPRSSLPPSTSSTPACLEGDLVGRRMLQLLLRT